MKNHTSRHCWCHILMASLISTGCMTKQRETTSVVLDNNVQSKVVQQKIGDVDIGHFIYTPEKFPLEDFFERLMAGRFKESIEQFDLNYKPSDTDNEALEKLLDEGLVPVYIRLKNNGSKPIQVSSAMFILHSGDQQFSALNETQLPNEFTRINPAAIGANVANAVILVALVVIVIAAAAATRGHFSSGGSGNQSQASGGPLFNRMEKTTTVAYNDYLLKMQQLLPDQEAMGLVFFKLPAHYASSSLSLEAKVPEGI